MDYGNDLYAKIFKMEDYSVNNSRVVEKVYLTFLQHSKKSTYIPSKPMYYASDTHVFNKPRVYEELEF